MPTDVPLDPDEPHDPLLRRVAELRKAQEHTAAEQILREALAAGGRTGAEVLRMELALADVLEDRGAWVDAEAVLRKALAARASFDRDHSEVVQLQSALDFLIAARGDADQDRTVIKDFTTPNGPPTPVMAPRREPAPVASPLALPRRVWIPIVLAGVIVGMLVGAWWFQL